MHSLRVNAENPWNLFAIDETLPKTPSHSKFSNATYTNSTQNFEKFLSNKVPVSFSGQQNVICCKICKILVVRNRYKEHYDDRHGTCVNNNINSMTGKTNMLPFEDDTLHSDKIYETKKVKRTKKKRSATVTNDASSHIKSKIEAARSGELISKKKSKKMKVKSNNKRLLTKRSLFDDLEYVNKKSKMNCEFIVEKQHFMALREDFLSSPKPPHDGKSFNSLSINDGLCYSNDSVHRTSSDSSTPPSLSLGGTLQTLSSPSSSSLNILNDLSSVIAEHYLLPSNDLTTDRAGCGGVSCKYQIDSLPWENLPPAPSKLYNSVSGGEIVGNEEDGEIARAVQSITGFYECLADEFEMISTSGGVAAAVRSSASVNELDTIIRSDLFAGDDSTGTTVIDCFLDEIGANTVHNNTNNQINNVNGAASEIIAQINGVDMFLDDCNNLCEYQIDSNLLNIFNADYEEKFETLINNTMNEFVTDQSPQSSVVSNDVVIAVRNDKKKSSGAGGRILQTKNLDPLKHCGVVDANGQHCYRSLLCKLHTMPQKRQVERSEDITSLIKGIRDYNKIKKMNKKSNQSSQYTRSSCSKVSGDSFLYNCSSSKSADEVPPVLEKNEASVFIGSSNCDGYSAALPSVQEAQPLVPPTFEKDIVIGGHSRSLMAMKSLVWRNRPRSQCHQSDMSNRFLLGSAHHQNASCLQTSTPIKQQPTESAFHGIITGSSTGGVADSFHSQSGLVGASGKTANSGVLTATTNDFSLDQFTSGFGGTASTASYYDVKYGANDVGDCQITALPMGKFQQIDACTTSNIYNDLPASSLTSSNNLAVFTNTKIIPFTQDANNTFLSAGADMALLANNKSQMTSPGQMLNGHHSTNIDIALTDSSGMNNVVSFSDHNTGGPITSIINTSSNGNSSLWNPILTDPSFSGSSKFISITDDRSGATQMLYPVRNGAPIMMVMNKNHKLINDHHHVDLSNENFAFSVNQSIPINSLLTLKQQQNTCHQNPSGQQRTINTHSQQQPQQHQTTVPTQQILSISPLELQRLTDGAALCTTNTGGQIINTDCMGKSSNDIFISSSKTNHDKKSPIVYQLSQTQSTGPFLSTSSSLSSKIDSNNLAKPLTVQSSTPNGITHRFVILPDGTISAFTQQPQQQQPSNQMKTNLATQQQQQLINRATTAIQHPLFGQLSNCGQSQSCFINGDKLIIAQPSSNQVASNGALSQQIIMPQIINQADLNNQQTSRFTLVHHQAPQQQQQPKLGATSKNNYNNANTRMAQTNGSNQVTTLDPSHQKLAFHIQTPTQYQNHTANTFFLAATPSGNSTLPLKQQIILQSADQMTPDFSLIDSNKFVDAGQYNAQRKNIIHQFDSSNQQEFDFLNHVINPSAQSIIIQQPPPPPNVNRPSQQISSSNATIVPSNYISQSSSQDINNAAGGNIIDGGGGGTAHSTVHSSNNNNQHIVISNNNNHCSNEQFAQSHNITLGQRQLSSTPFSSTASHCNASVVVNNQNQSNFKTVPPPLVISQQLLNQTVTNQFTNKSFIDIPYQQQQSQTQKTTSHINSVALDDNQFSNEFVIMQSMIA